MVPKLNTLVLSMMAVYAATVSADDSDASIF